MTTQMLLSILIWHRIQNIEQAENTHTHTHTHTQTHTHTHKEKDGNLVFQKNR